MKINIPSKYQKDVDTAAVLLKKEGWEILPKGGKPTRFNPQYRHSGIGTCQVIFYYNLLKI